MATKKPTAEIKPPKPRKKPGPKGPIATSFQKGKSGNPKGRKPGVKDHYNKLTNEQRQQIAAMTGGLTPLDLFLSVLRTEGDEVNQIPIELRLQAARDAAPYLHRRMPIAIEGGDASKPINIMDVVSLKGLTEKEIVTLLTLVQKAGANIIGDE